MHLEPRSLRKPFNTSFILNLCRLCTMRMCWFFEMLIASSPYCFTAKSLTSRFTFFLLQQSAAMKLTPPCEGTFSHTENNACDACEGIYIKKTLGPFKSANHLYQWKLWNLSPWLIHIKIIFSPSHLWQIQSIQPLKKKSIMYIQWNRS